MGKDKIFEDIQKMIEEAETMGDLQEVLHTIAYTIGGMVCHFEKDVRTSLLIELTQAMGIGLQLTSKAIGEPSDLEVVVGHGKG